MEWPQKRDSDRYGPSTNSSLIYQFVHNMDDPEIAGQFIDLYMPIIRKYLMSYVTDGHAIDDLAQEIFLKIMRSLKGFRHKHTGSFRAWLRTIVHSAHYDWYRILTAAGKGKLITNFDNPSFWDILPDRIVAAYDNEVLLIATQRVRLEIEPRTWQIFDLSQVQDEPAEKVAKQFGVSIRTVYNISRRVLKRLREMISYLDTKGSE